MSLKPIGWSTALIALGATVLWGGNVVALKLGLDTFPPFWSGFWRMFVGALSVGAWAWVRGTSLVPGRGEWRPLLFVSTLFTVQIMMLNVGVDFTSPAYGIVLLNTNPVFANLLAHFFVPGRPSFAASGHRAGHRVLRRLLCLSWTTGCLAGAVSGLGQCAGDALRAFARLANCLHSAARSNDRPDSPRLLADGAVVAAVPGCGAIGSSRQRRLSVGQP